MNEMNQVEEQLQSWTPRHPSSELKSKLFGAAACEPEQEQVSWSCAVAWLIPAAACLMAAFVVMKTEKSPDLFRSATNSAPVFFAMVGSNTVAMPLAHQEFQFANSGRNMALNVWSKASFHSAGELPSTGASLLSPTNHLQ